MSRFPTDVTTLPIGGEAIVLGGEVIMMAPYPGYVTDDMLRAVAAMFGGYNGFPYCDARACDAHDHVHIRHLVPDAE